MSDHGLAPRSLLPDDRFDYIYVVDLGLAVLVAIFFLFYFNRLFACIVSYTIRKYTWHKYRVYVDIQALQISPLAGRVFFRGFRYHGRNETILVNDGYITWRYWLRRVRAAGVSEKDTRSPSSDAPVHNGTAPGISQGEKGGQGSPTNLPCRISVKIRGLEWYIYNRTPAYDAIMENISKTDTADVPTKHDPVKRRIKLSKGETIEEKTLAAGDNVSRSNDEDQKKGAFGKDTGHSQSPLTSTTNTSSSSSSSSRGHGTADTLPIATQMLPARLECTKGAIVMGNQHTRSILTAKFDQADGHVDARNSSSQDLYKQTIDFDFTHPVIQLKANKDFKDSQLAEGARIRARERESTGEAVSGSPSYDQKEKRTLWDSLRYALPHAARSTTSITNKRVRSAHGDGNQGVPGQQRWLGLTRYMDEEDDVLEQERWKSVEYGRFSTIVDSPSIGASIRWDVPGQVSKHSPSKSDNVSEPTVDINGGEPPDWSIDLRLRGGEIHYGPWADRQRSDLQNIFFPTIYKDASPATPLEVGQSRVSTVFKLVVEIEERTTLVIPTREESKDWKWKGRATTGDGPKVKSRGKKHRNERKKGDKDNLNPEFRPYGWLDLKLLPDSTVSLTMDMVAGSSGYRTNLVLDLRKSEMASSVNHELLWRAESQIVSCDLSNPLGWNTLRQWQIDVQCNKLDIFLLRDHIFLLTDLVNDWSSGPSTDYYTFVPFKYSIGLHLDDFKLFVNANDSNIINNPADVDDNTFVVIWGKALAAEISIPLKAFRPTRNEITFDVGAHDGGFELRTPHWNTQHTFLNDTRVASLKELKIQGLYDYSTTTSPSLTDILRMEVHGDSPRINLYGFLIRYLMKIKDNYFGEDLHFRTLEEYQAHIRDQNSPNRKHPDSIPHAKVSNDLDVILKIVAERSIASLPARLYSSAESVELDIPSIIADLRFTNYYMDLAVFFSPISVARRGALILHSRPSDVNSSTQLFIDGLEISGHRLFGLPPTEPTYVCNWDFGLGSITGECSAEFLRAFLSGIRCFGFSFDDDENALPPLNPPVIHDVTFLRLSVQPIEVWLRLGPAAFLFSTKEVTLEFNDWAGARFSQQMYLHVSDLIIAVLENKRMSQEKASSRNTQVTQAYFRATVDLRMLKRKKNADEDRQLQQSHLKFHDSRTHRIPWLLHSDQAAVVTTLTPGTKMRPPAMQFPPMPQPSTSGQDPVADYDSSLSTSSRATSSRVSTHKSSFLASGLSERGRAVRAGLGDSDESKAYSCDGEPVNKQSTKHGTNGEFGRSGGQMAQTGFAFSSPYKMPFFPLCGLQPDLRDVPSNFSELQSTTSTFRASAEAPINVATQGDQREKASLLINLSQGIRAFLTSVALLHVEALLDALKLDDLTALLDTLHMETMADVVTSLSLQDHNGDPNIMDLHIRIPFVQARYLNVATADLDADRGCVGLTVEIESLNLTSRASGQQRKTSGVTSSSTSSVHVALNKINCSIIDAMDHTLPPKSMMRFTLLDPVLWITTSHRSVLDMQLKNFEVLVIPYKLDSLLLLGLNEVKQIQHTIHRCSQTAKEQALRFRKFVYHLTTDGEEFRDPPFLTKASYVLRSATNHLRTCDSWKMVSRLRYIFNSLSIGWKGSVFEQCRQDPANIPNDARLRVIANFEHWRAWDVTHVKGSSLMQGLYGKETVHPIGGAAEIPLSSKASIRMRSVRLALETSSTPNEIVFERLSLSVEHDPLALSSAYAQQSENSTATSSKVQFHSARATACLNWELCEVIGTVMGVLHQQSATESIDSTSSADLLPANERRTVNHKVHAVLALEVCIFNGNSPNLGNTSMCQGVKISSLLSTARAGMVTSLLIAAEAATSETTDRSKILIQSKLRGPSILATLDDQIATAGFHSTWKVAASCSELSLKVLQDPLIMIETVHTLLRDEASYVRRLATSFSSDPAHLNSENPLSRVRESNNRAHVTLVVDSYLVSIAILPSLSYRVAGRVARSTVQHGLRQATETLIDCDIKDHRHVFSTLSRDGDEDIAALDIPPINGCLSLELGPKQKCATVHTMVESIQLDATSVHSLLVTVNRPEIGDLMTGIEREVPLIEQRLGDLFTDSKSQTDTTKPPNKPLLYDAHLIVAGLSIHATSPTSPAATRAGRLHLNLGSVQVKGTNKASGLGPPLEFPELEVHLNSIQATLLRIEAGEEIPNGGMVIAAVLKLTSKTDGESGKLLRAYRILVPKLELDLNAQTPTMMIDIIGHLQNTLKTMELSSEFYRLRTLRRTRLGNDTTVSAFKGPNASSSDSLIGSTALFSAMYIFQMASIRVSWKIGSTTPISPGREAEDLIITISKIDLSTRRDNAARLLIENFQLQMVPLSKVMLGRSPNSALLPEVVFNVAYLSTGKDRRLAFQAAGKSLDLRLTSQFILPASDLRRSIAHAVQEVREATASWNASAHEKGTHKTALLGNKQFASVLIDADFAGAVVYIQGRSVADSQGSAMNTLHSKSLPQHGRYNQFTPGNASSNTTLRSPGLAFKIEYKDPSAAERSLNAEVKVDASSNVLQPTVVPLIMEISSSVKEMVSDAEGSDRTSTVKSKPARFLNDDRLLSADPSAIFGKCRVNLGLRICKQEFSLTCQPITQVDAIAFFEDIYITVNTVQSDDHGQFYTLSGVFKGLQASVQHAYSRDPTGSFSVESVFVSLMSSKHVSDANGLSVILKISPMKAQINARQLHDFLLFREVWAPPEIRHAPAAHAPSASTEPQAFIVQRYQQIAATGAFPWNATATIAQLEIQLDLGQSLGRTALVISNLWISSKKSSDWEQNLCLGFDRISMDSTGRMSGLIELKNLRVRTSIQWPMMEQAQNQTPLVQASLAFDQLRVKAAFDYQAFAIANITAVEFLMYNVKDLERASSDRLVCIVEGTKVQAFCTATSAAQGLALFQAVERLIQEKQAAYDASLKEIERFLRRRSAVSPLSLQGASKIAVARWDDDAGKVPIRLQTKVIIRLGAINLGVYPSTFFDNQVFKAEALNVSAQFSVLLDHEKIHSSLSLTLGQLRVALSGFTRPSSPKKLGEIGIDEVVAYAVDARGGTILKVPEVLATMQTWQLPHSTQIDYIFKSSFEGNIDVGWNYSRISFLRGMFANHSRALAQRLGKPLPQSTVQITGGPQPEGEKDAPLEGGQAKITALVNVPLSKYQYRALQEPVIDTPKLTQLGDATPPLEWIGLHRGRLPNLTHQIVIVSLLELAKEVEDAYTRILGSS